jgi:anti-sigma B factor antagonist
MSQRPSPAAVPNSFRFSRPALNFAVGVNERRSVATLELAGEFDLAARDRFDFHLRFVMSGDPDHIVIDLRGLSFIDSSGIELLLGADALSRQDGFRLWIVSGEGQVKQALDICGVANRLPLCAEPPVLPD